LFKAATHTKRDGSKPFDLVSLSLSFWGCCILECFSKLARFPDKNGTYHKTRYQLGSDQPSLFFIGLQLGVLVAQSSQDYEDALEDDEFVLTE